MHASSTAFQNPVSLADTQLWLVPVRVEEPLSEEEPLWVNPLWVGAHTGTDLASGCIVPGALAMPPALWLLHLLSLYPGSGLVS